MNENEPRNVSWPEQTGVGWRVVSMRVSVVVYICIYMRYEQPEQHRLCLVVSSTWPWSSSSLTHSHLSNWHIQTVYDTLSKKFTSQRQKKNNLVECAHHVLPTIGIYIYDGWFVGGISHSFLLWSAKRAFLCKHNSTTQPNVHTWLSYLSAWLLPSMWVLRRVRSWFIYI